MPITREEVRRIALLARLSLTESEEAEMTGQLDHILEHFQRLNDLETGMVEPTAHITPMETPFRDDVVANQPNTDELLANAPARDGNFFRVPKIIE
jgi:aspartyl-tRNA(Asn)/glutamyl-tRNA(Gln) amidotransferase subunit C